jgi:hypothetical protein
MNLQHENGGTLEDGLLVQYLHGELDAEMQQALAAHLDRCPPCRAQSDRLQQRMRDATDALQLSAFPEPRPQEWRALLASVRREAAARRRAARLRLAAGWIIGVAALAGAASSPVRAWIAQRWSNANSDAQPAVQIDQQTPGTAGLTFVPGGTVLEVNLESTQSGGFLALRFTEDPLVNVSVAGGASEQFAWGRNVVRIINQTRSSASYTVTVARSVERVTVQVGQLPPIALSRSTVGTETVEIGLTTGAVRNSAPRDEQ